MLFCCAVWQTGPKTNWKFGRMASALGIKQICLYVKLRVSQNICTRNAITSIFMTEKRLKWELNGQSKLYLASPKLSCFHQASVSSDAKQLVQHRPHKNTIEIYKKYFTYFHLKPPPAQRSSRTLFMNRKNLWAPSQTIVLESVWLAVSCFGGEKKALGRERPAKVNPPTEIPENRKLEIVVCIQAQKIYTKSKRHWKVKVESVTNLNATWESRHSSHVEKGREGVVQHARASEVFVFCPSVVRLHSYSRDNLRLEHFLKSSRANQEKVNKYLFIWLHIVQSYRITQIYDIYDIPHWDPNE